MEYQIPKRNYDNIKWRSLRVAADAAFNDLSDLFSRAYYDYWRFAVSQPVGPFDIVVVEPDDPEDQQSVDDAAIDSRNKTDEQFLDLQVMLEQMYIIMRHKINHKMNQDGAEGVIPQSEYRYVPIYDQDTQQVIGQRDLVMEAKDRMASLSNKLGVKARTMMDHYRLRTKELAGYEFQNWSID